MSPIASSIDHTPDGTTKTPTADSPPQKPTILHLGDPIVHNHTLHHRLEAQFNIIRPPLCHRDRQAFIQHLKDRTWGNFSAIMRPFWATGGEMGRWDRELIDLLPPEMCVMASAGAGFDWVDVGILGEHGILYCNGAGASSESVADMALYLIISVFRQMTWSALAARSNSPTQWQKAHQNVPLSSHNPRGHRLGIVGMGNIGFAIARKVQVALGMSILYTDIVRKPPAQEAEVDAIFFPTLDDLLPNSDCILIATPHTGQSLLTAHTLALLPVGARIVNIARGSLIDEKALADALDSGHIAAAGLDVHAHEPNVSERLSQSWNVTLTSHTGGGSVETNVGFERLAMENVEQVLTGGNALTPVNQHVLAEKKPLYGVNGVDGDDHPGKTEEEEEGMDGAHVKLIPDHDGAAIGARTDQADIDKENLNGALSALQSS